MTDWDKAHTALGLLQQAHQILSEIDASKYEYNTFVNINSERNKVQAKLSSAGISIQNILKQFR